MTIKTGFSDLLIAGKYRIEEQLGEGSVSRVYSASYDSKFVAIKIMKQSFLKDGETLARFEREIRTYKHLIHENIVQVYEGGHLPTGEPFLVMELLKGESLAQLLKESGTLPATRALSLVLQAAEALKVAHKRGFVHRDIKPQNLMIVRQSWARDQVKVLDFGIAKLSDSRQQFESFSTHPGEVVGTPLYMSPEQILGNKIDGRADIYALGCVLYKCLCGHAPIEGKNAIDAMRNHLEMLPPHLNYYSKEKLPEALNALVQKALAKMPEDRYSDMTEFADAIRKYTTPALLGKILTIIPKSRAGNSRQTQKRSCAK